MSYGGCILIHCGLPVGWSVGRSLVVGHWSLVIGCWSLVVCRWLLVVGCWSLVVGQSVHNKGCQALGGFPPKTQTLASRGLEEPAHASRGLDES
jgi:hypothetical protein